MSDGVPYQPNPRYPLTKGAVEIGWQAAVDTLPDGGLVLSVDGPLVLDWSAVVSGMTEALSHRGRTCRHIDLREYLLPWREVVELTTTEALAHDPDFARLAEVSLEDLLDALPRVSADSDEVVVVTGPGSALVSPDVTWYADLPKRFAEAAVVNGQGSNLGQGEPDGRATTKRLFYIDWTILDRHREAIVAEVDRWIDTQDSTAPASIDGAVLRRTARQLAQQPFRTRPTFNTAPWGGHWGQRRLGLGVDAPNSALGYELIAPESGILLGEEGAQVEIPFQLVVGFSPREILGEAVHADFGTSFPVRFDYLDTMQGGNLSVHCHPRDDYMSRVFGWPYTQHETYYLMVGADTQEIFLGLRDGVDVETFHKVAKEAAEHGRAFHIHEYIQSFPSQLHQLYMIPAGTPHGSGEGNVVLEVSATPYLYSLRFYDWLRQDGDGRRRPVHVEHAFANLDSARRGGAVSGELIQAPQILRSAEGWREELIGSLPEMFFEVRRAVIEGDDPMEDATNGRFHVINVVDGDGVLIETHSGFEHPLNYAETLVIPASVGPYSLRRRGNRPVRVVKALVK